VVIKAVSTQSNRHTGNQDSRRARRIRKAHTAHDPDALPRLLPYGLHRNAIRRVIPLEHNLGEREELRRCDLVFSCVANIWKIAASISTEEWLRDTSRSSMG
jgi:hypothetical protein